MTASGLYWLVYEMYRYQAGKISFIKIRNRSAWNKNILYQIFIYICVILVFFCFSVLITGSCTVCLTFKSDGPIIFWMKASWNRLFTEDWTIGLISRYIYVFLLWIFRNWVYTHKAGFPDVKQAATSKLNENLATFKKLEPCTRKKFYLTVYFS